VSTAFGGLLRAHREWAGLTQQCLASMTAVSERAIRDLEQGRARRPRPVTVRLLADGLALRDGARAAFVAAARGVGSFTPPLPLAGLLGREAELAVLAELLAADGDRVVTLTGVAGVGKTRLATEAAARLPGPVTWCGPGVRPPVPSDGTVLVLDGVSEPRAAVAGLLRHRPLLRMLCTAPAPLGLPGERVVPLLPLPVPDGPVGAADSPAVRLLLRHIRALDPQFRLDGTTVAAVAGICVLLDGHPGALERAGTACALRSVHVVHQRLAAGPVADLSASLALLAPAERRLLDRLAALAGPWSLDEADADPAAVHTLLRHGLLRRRGPARFQVLGLVRVAPQPVGA
jgi:hypothetical protein